MYNIYFATDHDIISIRITSNETEYKIILETFNLDLSVQINEIHLQG